MISDDPLRRLPYPELVEPQYDKRDYEIHDSRHMSPAPGIGMVNQIERVMLAPLSDDGAFVRRHEMAHVKWSPKQLPRVAFDQLILMAVEDARINLGLGQLGFAEPEPAALKIFAVGLAKRDVAASEFGAYVVRCLASIGTDIVGSLLDVSRDQAPRAHALAARLVDMVKARLEGGRLRTTDRSVASFDDTVHIAAEVAEEMRSADIAMSNKTRRRVISSIGGCISCETRGIPLRRYGSTSGIAGFEDCEAAKMHIVEPALTVKIEPARGRHAGGRRAVQEGAIVRNVGRWYIDRKIFRGRSRHRGGTVLVDTSSSMRFSAADVDRIVRNAPMATIVAMYSGRDREGELRIIARDCRRAAVENLKPYGPGNQIDLPALEWLAHQPAPRVWFSDARVTGVNDMASRIIARQCRIVCLKHGIRRAETAQEVAALLEGRALRVLPLMAWS